VIVDQLIETTAQERRAEAEKYVAEAEHATAGGSRRRKAS
jgi:hypothetical protein